MAFLVRQESFPPNGSKQFVCLDCNEKPFLFPEEVARQLEWNELLGILPVAGEQTSAGLPDAYHHLDCTESHFGADTVMRQTSSGACESQLRAMQAAGQVPEQEAEVYGSPRTKPLSYQFSNEDDACGGKAGSTPAGVLNAQAAASAATSQVPALPARPSSATINQDGEIDAASPLPEGQAHAEPASLLKPSVVRDIRPALSSVCCGGSGSPSVDDMAETVCGDGGAEDDAATADTGGAIAAGINAALACRSPRRQSSGCVRATYLPGCVSTASTYLAEDGDVSEMERPDGEAPVEPELPVQGMSFPHLGSALAAGLGLQQLPGMGSAAAAVAYHDGLSLQEGGGEVGGGVAGAAVAVSASGRPRRGRAAAVPTSAMPVKEGGGAQRRPKRTRTTAAGHYTDDADDEDFEINEAEQEEHGGMENDDGDEEYTVGKRSGAVPKRQRTGATKKTRTGGKRVTGSVCLDCGAVETPQWRHGPQGRRTLCNACGVRYCKVQNKAKAVTGRR